MIRGESLAGRKMRRTRQTIADTARRLFTEHGFDHVSVAQIAAEAEVAEKTVYNHFPTKADLVFDANDLVLERLLAAVRERAPGQAVLDAVRECLSRVGDDLGEREAPSAQRAFRQLVADSPALQAHQRAMAARYEHALAEVIAKDTGADPGAAEPLLAAIGLIGALRVGYATAEHSGGRDAATRRALDLLEAGLGGYAIRPDTTSTPRTQPS